MHFIKSIIIVVLAFLLPGIGFSQHINWAQSGESHPLLFQVNTGLDYGLTFGAGFGYQLKSRLPIVLNATYSIPSGEHLLDDYKSTLGGQIRLFKTGNVYYSANIRGVFRRNQNDYVRLLNFGSDMSAIIGYYRSHWFIAGEAGFDKAIVTHFRHTEAYREIYPQVVNGWYEPATGGNFYYKIQTGVSIKQHSIYLTAGKLITQDFKTTPLFPVTGEVGFILRFTT